MNTELTNIKDFIRENLDPCYYETAEEMMLINPLCGVVKKFADEFKAKEKRIEKEKEAIRLRDIELKERFESIWKKENEAEEKSKEVEEKSKELNEREKQIDVRYASLPKVVYQDNSLNKLYEIKAIICQYFDVDIDRKTRKREVVYARHMAMYYSRKLTKLSLQDIGSLIASRDHATVLYAVKTINNLRRYPETQMHLKELNKIFGINGQESS